MEAIGAISAYSIGMGVSNEISNLSLDGIDDPAPTVGSIGIEVEGSAYMSGYSDQDLIDDNTFDGSVDTKVSSD